MLRSLRGRLVLLLVLLVVATGATAALMVGLFEQSTAARVGQAAAENSRACEAIAAAYRQQEAELAGVSLKPDDGALSERLNTLVKTALASRTGIRGGIWQSESGSLAFAFPTYEGAAERIEPPGGQLPRIRDTNAAALSTGHPASSRFDARSQTLLISACPLPGPIPHLSAWTMTWTFTFTGRSYYQLMAGQAVLLVTMLLAATLLTQLTMTWSRHVSQIEAALNAYDVADLPVLPVTRERELDRIVLALNEAGRRLSVARQRGDELARQMATAERLAAIGRVAAGMAHEIRNPIAAMRLKAESAVAGGPARQSQALHVILGEIERLDALVQRLLSITEHDVPKRERIEVSAFLATCVAQHTERAAAQGVTITFTADALQACFDPDQVQRGLDNLILNAINAAPANSLIEVTATHRPDALVLCVHDQGLGPPADIQKHLFEPFVTGRPDGTGLGLSIVREVAEAHGGTAHFLVTDNGTTFEITLPWLTS